MPASRSRVKQVSWLVAGQMGDAGPAAGAADDLVQPGCGQRLAAPLALEDHEHLVGW
jgi:hypothetical protein